jgi:O-antigen/teichoic acid export membrane protein
MGLLLTPAKLRVWGWRSAISLVDQGLTSGAGFAVNLLLARWMAAEVYGAFAVAFAGFLFVSGFHNVLLLEPMSVIGPSRYAERLPAYFRAQIMVHLVLVGPLSAASLLASLFLWRVTPGSPLVGAVLGAGLTLPFLLLAWLARRMCYVVQQPSMAVLGSGFYVTFVAAGLFVLGHYHWLGSFTAFLLLGCGSVFTAGLLVWRLGLLKRESNEELGVSWRVALRGNWIYGRWLVGSTVLSSVSSQTQMFLAAAMLGLGSAGILRAMQIPSLVMTQIAAAAGLLALTSFSYDFGNGHMEWLRRKAMLVSVGLVGGLLAFAFVLTIFAGQTERILFGGRYAAYAHLMPVLALVPAAMGFSTGYSMAMRASQKPRFDLLANAIAAPVGVVSAIFFIRWWGIVGAAASMAVGFAAYAISVSWIYYHSRETAQKRGFSK